MSSSFGQDFDIRNTQNYLKSRRLIEHLLNRSSISPQDLVVEIGPGKGKITRCLVEHCRHVIAVEKDSKLALQLRRMFENDPHVTVCHSDFLSFPLPKERYKMFANIPFNITTAIVTKLTRDEHPPEDCYLVVQRQAAERFCGVPQESLYALLLKPWFEPSVVYRFRREDFDPAPRVDVVMLSLRKRGPPLVQPREAQRYRDFVVYSFTHPRPGRSGIHIGNFTARQSKHFLLALGIDPYLGPTEIRFEQWLEIFLRFISVARSEAWRNITGSEGRLLRQQAGLQKRHRTPKAAAVRRQR